jgi:DNA-binding beta-propeller fold protein YncE
MRKRHLLAGLAVVAALIALGFGQHALDNAAQANDKQAPTFVVDPFWPKPLPNHWILGATIGISVDSRDHVYIIHRRDTFNERTEIGAATDPVKADCCIPAPNVLEFDPEGNLVNHWGGPGEGYEWPSLAQYGSAGAETDSHSTENFGSVAEIAFDPQADEAYVADGYRNKRVAVLDVDTGALKRYWGAYGNEPEDVDLGPFQPGGEPAMQFRNPVHCAQPSNDGLVYVCDRVNNRLQVFRSDGLKKFL